MFMTTHMLLFHFCNQLMPVLWQGLKIELLLLRIFLNRMYNVSVSPVLPVIVKEFK